MATLSEEGAIRAALAALYSNGGFVITIRMPGLAVAGSDAEQLGLSTPQFQDVPIGPAVWRKLGVDTALVLSASGIANLFAATTAASAEAIFYTAAGVLVSGILYQITKVEPLLVAGIICAYRLTVQEPVQD